jgi:micrococcal nuclease
LKATLIQWAVLLGLAWALGACSSGVQRLPTPTLGRELSPTRPVTPTPAATDTAVLSPTLTPTPSASPSATPTNPPLPTATPAADRTAAQVVRVLDGNTIVVRILEPQTLTATVRYLGMNAPALAAAGKPSEPGSAEASAGNKTLVNGKTVYLEQDTSDTDKQGRLLRYVFLDDDTLVNAELVRQGLASAVITPPDTRYQSQLLDAQQEAYEAKRGVWATTASNPASSRTPTERASVSHGTPTRTPTRGTPPPPTASASSGIKPQDLVTLTSPVPRGSVVALTVQTLPNLSCSAAIYFPSRPEVRAMVSAKNGVCSWSWTVYSNVSAGTYPILVTTGDTTKQYQLEVE